MGGKSLQNKSGAGGKAMQIHQSGGKFINHWKNVAPQARRWNFSGRLYLYHWSHPPTPCPPVIWGQSIPNLAGSSPVSPPTENRRNPRSPNLYLSDKYTCLMGPRHEAGREREKRLPLLLQRVHPLLPHGRQCCGKV